MPPVWSQTHKTVGVFEKAAFHSHPHTHTHIQKKTWRKKEKIKPLLDNLLLSEPFM